MRWEWWRKSRNNLEPTNVTKKKIKKSVMNSKTPMQPWKKQPSRSKKCTVDILDEKRSIKRNNKWKN